MAVVGSLSPQNIRGETTQLASLKSFLRLWRELRHQGMGQPRLTTQLATGSFFPEFSEETRGVQT